MEIRGIHVFGGFVGFFGIIIGVNLILATQAVRTFSGVEVKNSYVASQEFDMRRTAQQALGWDVDVTLEGDELILAITDEAGLPVTPESIESIFGKATSVAWDQTPEFAFDGAVYRAVVDGGPGNWNLRMTALAANGTEFRQRVIVDVR